MTTFISIRSFATLRNLFGTTGVALAVVAMPLLHVGVARAEGNFTAGAICHATAGGAVAYNNFAEVVNVGSTSMHVVCPVDRSSFGAVGQSEAILTVTDNSTSSNVSCAINSKNPTGSSFTFGTGSSSGTNVNIGFVMATSHITSSDYTWVSCDVQAVSPTGAKSSLQNFLTFEL